MSFKRVINVVETHDGEPMRVVTSGVPLYDWGYMGVELEWKWEYKCLLITKR